jgi:acyl-CoA hydrolase
VKAEHFLREVVVTVFYDKVVAHDSIQVGSFVKLLVGVVEGAMSMPRRERAIGNKELQHDGLLLS